MATKGVLLVVSGPSGTGKGTVLNPLRKRNKDLKYSVSVTTRKPRAEDIPGVTYNFVDKETFEKMIEDNELLEWDCFCGNYYGTPKKYIRDCINDGYDVILEITVPGASQIINSCNKEDYVGVFIAPPSMEELRRRIFARASEDKDEIERRLERAAYEFEQMTLYDYVIINDDVDKAVYDMESIINAERLRYKRSKDKLDSLGLK